MDDTINQIVQLKELIDTNPTNDFFLFPFMALVLKLTDEKGFVSESGMKLLHNNIQQDIDIVKEGEKKPSQYALTRLSLWFCLAYNLIKFFCGFVVGLGEIDNIYSSKIPVELMDYLKLISVRVLPQLEPLEKTLNHYTNQLKDKFAKYFDEEKRKCWTKDLFNNSVHIPAHIDDVPEGFDRFGSNSRPAQQ